MTPLSINVTTTANLHYRLIMRLGDLSRQSVPFGSYLLQSSKHSKSILPHNLIEIKNSLSVEIAAQFVF